ncbi:MAG: hypothetical protein M3Y25_09600 [Thermoproteota archaeon]|nr:hypothetical protein [Thermoproteota archaeon]
MTPDADTLTKNLSEESRTVRKPSIKIQKSWPFSKGAESCSSPDLQYIQYPQPQSSKTATVAQV